nr:peptide transporter ptr2 [Quercus suber]
MATKSRELPVHLPNKSKLRTQGLDVVGLVTMDQNILSELEISSLPLVADILPNQVWCVLLIGTAECSAFYDLQAPFRRYKPCWLVSLYLVNYSLENYISNRLDDPLRPGALVSGQASATSLSYLFSLLMYTMPIISAVVNECYLGKFDGLQVFTLPIAARSDGCRVILISKAIQVDSVAGLALTFLEKDVASWAACLLLFCILWISVPTLWISRSTLVLYRREIDDTAKQCPPVDRDNAFVADLQRALIACRIFAMTPTLWLRQLRISDTLVPRAGLIEAGSLPNDASIDINPSAISIFLPLVRNAVYPILRKMKLPSPPINRITVGSTI